MDTITIGTDLKVGRLGFGAMRLTGEPHLDRAGGVALARRAVELGVTFLDTADSYDLGENEELLAAALHPYPDGVVIATKGGQCHPGQDWIPCGRPEYLRQQAELSLRRLRLDRIDLYQLHRVDPLVPLADQVGALRRLQEEGKVRHVGLSEVSLAQLVEAAAITPIVSVQNRYNLADRAAEPLLEHCERNGMPFIPWFPVVPINRDHAPTATARAVDEVAARHGASRSQVALAWLLHRSPALLPIPGTSSPRHLAENVAAADLCLSADDLALLN